VVILLKWSNLWFFFHMHSSMDRDKAWWQMVRSHWPTSLDSRKVCALHCKIQFKKLLKSHLFDWGYDTWQWRSQDLVVVATLEGGIWEGVFPSHREKVWEGAVPPSQPPLWKIFRFFVWKWHVLCIFGTFLCSRVFSQGGTCLQCPICGYASDT